MKTSHYVSLFICTLLAYCASTFAADPNHYLEHKIPPIISTNIKKGIYIVERFWASTHNAAELPLVSGPACPCIIVFAAKPGCPAIFGAHLYHLNSIKNLINSINTFYKLPSYGEKSKLRFSLFTRTLSTIDTEYTFKEGAHLNRFKELMHALDSAYNIIHCSYHFDNDSTFRSIADRFVICTGLDEKNRLQVYRFDPIESGTFKSKAHLDDYTFLHYQKTFGLHQMLNILPGNMWESLDQDLIQMESKDTITFANQLAVAPENSFNEMFAYRQGAKEDALYKRNTQRRALCEQKLMNVNY